MGKKKLCQNPFTAILWHKKNPIAIKLVGGGGSMALPIRFFLRLMTRRTDFFELNQFFFKKFLLKIVCSRMPWTIQTKLLLNAYFGEWYNMSFLENTGFRAVYYIGTMSRFVRAKTCFLEWFSVASDIILRTMVNAEVLF